MPHSSSRIPGLSHALEVRGFVRPQVHPNNQEGASLRSGYEARRPGVRRAENWRLAVATPVSCDDFASRETAALLSSRQGSLPAKRPTSFSLVAEATIKGGSTCLR
jgi:hypothetical protein